MRYNAKGFCSGELYKKEIVKKSVAANFEAGFPCFSSLWLNRAVLHLQHLGVGGGEWGVGRDPILAFDMKLFYLFFIPPFFISLFSFFLNFILFPRFVSLILFFPDFCCVGYD